jgi:Putative beta-barrel porin-2, OmpL-like. bbp2
MKVVFCTLYLLIVSNTILAQDSSKVSFSGYTEIYYQFDFDKPQNHQRPFFLYNHKRHNEVNVNLALAKVNYASKNVRANIGLMTGNYLQYNLAAEPQIFQYVYEANVGVELSKKNKIWLDAGIMPSHIGFESAVSADCYTLSRSLLAENSPYFETGIKLTKTNQKENFFISVLYLNGWQRIQKPDGFSKPSFGLQINGKPNKKLTLNYSNFVGTDKPDSVNAFRTYHNFYAIYETNSKTSLIAGFDVGTEKKAVWYSPVLILKKVLAQKAALAIRAEWFKDKNQIMQTTGTQNGFNVVGLSMNYDYAFASTILFRIEAKNYFSNSIIFRRETYNTNFCMLGSLSIKF